MIFNTDKCHIYVKHATNATFKVFSWSNRKEILWSKYQIKESDFRVKTMSFTSPQYIDLTTGIYGVLISSPYHPNFSGVILSVDYDEDTKLYSYHCQDWSRFYQSKFEAIFSTQTIYHTLRYLITRGGLSGSKPHKSKDLDKWRDMISGLKSIELFDQKALGNIVSGNPMKTKPHIIMRDKSFIDAIRDLTIGTMRYADVWFNDKGVIQIEPLSRNDWYNTGLVLSDDEFMNRKFKFDTTNAITRVIVSGTKYSLGKAYSSEDLLGLDLSAFFGSISAGLSSSNDTTVIKGNNKSTTNATANTNTSNSNASKNGNPFNNKSKKVWINADNGSDGMKSELIRLLENDGWYVHDGGTGSNTHYSDYWNVSSNYSVYVTVYNGFCAGTIREAYSSSIQNELKGKGVELVVVFDTREWTNPQGMKPYRYGDFSGYSASRAWDDNFSASNPAIHNVSDFFKSNNAKYCANPTASGIMAQFRAGGYFASKNGTPTNNTQTNNSASNKATALNNALLNKSNASDKVFEHARDYFSCKITLPLGNPVFTKVHTNQFLFTYLPVEFDLANWTILAKKLSSSANRFSGADYYINRWYIEGTTIDVDVKGTAKMGLDLNAFASSTSKFSDEYKSFTKAFNDASKSGKSTSNTSSTKSTSNATSSNNTSLFSSKAGRDVGGNLDTALKKIIEGCNTEEQKAYCIYDWVDRYINYEFYYNSKYSSSEVLTGHQANCWDTAFLIYDLCTKAKVRCEVYNGYYHFLDGDYGHLWNKLPYKGKMVFADTGRSSRNPIGEHGSGRYIVSGGDSPYKKNY